MSHIALTESPSSTKRLAADSFSRSVVLLGCLLIAQRGIGFLRSFYVCGALAPAEVGQWDLAFNFLSIVAPLAVFGIPGSFGRYVARYESNGQQNRFLNQTVISCIGLTCCASMAIWLCRDTVARYFFGSVDNADMVTVLAAGLPLVIFFNFGTSWFSGKRLNRVVFRTQFAQSLFFAILCVLAFQLYSVTASSVVIAYLISCFVGLCLAASYACFETNSDDSSTTCQESSAIWSKILPFAIWVWVSNALVNLFSVCDRLLLVNFNPDPGTDVQFLIGQYHTACILPLLVLSIGAMAGSMLIPYLSKDWESKCHDAVTDRMNLMLKSIGLLCIFASVGILILAPVLFGGLWQNKFAIGESLLPTTLCYCSLAAMTLVAQKYFWCIEKTWLSSSILLIGLVLNFALGLAFIGPYGIEGVIAATVISHAFVLAGVLLLCKQHGLNLDRGVVLVVLFLFTIALGKIAVCLSLAILLLLVVSTSLIVGDSVKAAAIVKLKSLRISLFGLIS